MPKCLCEWLYSPWNKRVKTISFAEKYIYVISMSPLHFSLHSASVVLVTQFFWDYLYNGLSDLTHTDFITKNKMSFILLLCGQVQLIGGLSLLRYRCLSLKRCKTILWHHKSWSRASTLSGNVLAASHRVPVSIAFASLGLCRTVASSLAISTLHLTAMFDPMSVRHLPV